MDTVSAVPAPIPGDDASVSNTAVLATGIVDPVVQDASIPPSQVIRDLLRFGDTLCRFESEFSEEHVEQAVDMAVSIAVASADPDANVYRQDVLIFTQPPLAEGLPTVPVVYTTVSPELDYFINTIIEESPSTFAVDRGIWEISLEFDFGNAAVLIISSFLSHEVPVAWPKARAMAKASGNFRRLFMVPPPDCTVFDPVTVGLT
jgi:hypothetical protein